MPYNNEYANKSSHFDIVKSDDIKEFLNTAKYLEEPSEETTKEICRGFKSLEEKSTPANLPNKIIATDGSFYEASINKHLPSSKVGYIKIGCLLIDLDKFNSLNVYNSKFVDPFKVAELQNDNSSITFPMPSANIIAKGKDSVADSFRFYIDKHLLDYRSDKNNYKTSLRTTLFKLASLRPDTNNTDDKMYIHRCPSCKEKNIEISDIEEQQYCNNCGKEIYPSDILRIWEEVTEYQANGGPISRFMMVLEHLMPIHYLRIIKEFNPELSASIFNNLAFILDGPLAVFGTSAWLHRSIMKYIYFINSEQRKKGLNDILFIGIQKTGQIVEFVKTINNYLDDNTIFLIDDDFRYKYITFSKSQSKNGFGFETYYGQDFIYKTKTSRNFIFSLPFPFNNKNENFNKNKIDLKKYKNLNRAVKLIDSFECDLFENSVIPVALAHRYTAISLKPGSKVLDLLTEEELNSK